MTLFALGLVFYSVTKHTKKHTLCKIDMLLILGGMVIWLKIGAAK